jgi:serine/threonine-protein kinase
MREVLVPDDPRVQQLLDELLDTDGTPEEVCASCVELLPIVRTRWQQMCQARDELDVMFPAMAETGEDVPPADGAPLPSIPGYEVEAVLGVGGMGVVFRARHLDLNRVVALKMALAGEYAGPRERERFRREAEAVARLQHPNVVQVFDVGEADGRPFFTMEFLDGGSLAQRMKGTPVPAREAAEMVATLAGAVEAAHRSGIVHRDLKPANILRTADGVLKVSDFGLARRLDGPAALTRSGAAVGTPSYMAPEQARGHADQVGPAADIYALGAILYECLTGRPPFRGETAAETIDHVIHREPTPPGRLNTLLPRDLETICLKCLDKDPGRRYPAAADLAADLGRFLNHEPIRARPVGRVERGLRWARRRPAAAGLLAAVVLLVLVGGISAGLQYRHVAADRDRQARTDQEVHAVLERARGPLEEAWQAQDLAKLAEVAVEGNRAVDIARTGTAGAAVRDEAEAFRVDADDRLVRAKKNRVLLDEVLDVLAQHEGDSYPRDKSPRPRVPAQASTDEQYAAAFRRWGLDIEGTPEAEVAARLRSEPDAFVAELIAALDDWMLERRHMQPGAEWRRLYRLAEQLDRGERHRQLRAVLAGDSPPRAESVAGLAAAGLAWPALWKLARGDDWRQLREVRAGIDPRTDPVLTIVLLAQGLAAVGDAAGAEQLLREAVTVRPDQVVLLDALGKLVEARGPAGRARAIECYRAARARRPSLGLALSGTLIQAGRADEAEDVLRDLLRQRPENPVVYNLVGVCLDAQKKHEEAEGAYRKAIDLAPGFASVYYNLGMCLADQNRNEAAEAACRQGLALRPNDSDAHYFLGYILDNQKRYVAAEAAFRKAIALRPDRAEAHYNLGNALMAQGKYPAAEAAYRNAIDLKPDDPLAHINLGMALSKQHKPGAETEFRRAIDLKPDDARAHNNLGMILSKQRRHAEAEAAYRKAIALEPGFALAHLNLGSALMEQARFGEGVEFVRKGKALLPANDPLQAQASDLLEWCRLYLALDSRLPALLRGTDRPADAVERIVLAQLCRIKGLDAAAARFYSDGFAADPVFADAVPPGIHFNAAGCAARAARGDGTDAPAGAAERAALRAKALKWLRVDFAFHRKRTASRAAAERNAAAGTLDDWLRDPDLAALRPGWRRMGMPARERAEWDALWAEVEATLARTQGSAIDGAR